MAYSIWLRTVKRGFIVYDLPKALRTNRSPSPPLFTIAIEPEQADYKISYCISGHPVKSEILSSEKKALLLTQLGLQHDKEYVNGPVFSLEGYRKEISDSQLAQLTDDKFGAGGVHKRFEPKTGVLQARDQTGCADFDCEGQVQGYADDNAELQQYISTQQRIPTPPASVRNSITLRSHSTTVSRSPPVSLTGPYQN